MKKFFVKNLCLCCNMGKENKKKTTVPFVQQVAIHDIVANGNGNGNKTVDKPIYTNKAYKEDEGLQTSSNSNSAVFFRTRQLSQISDISEIFRLPMPDERSLGDVVIEEYDHKSRTLHAAETGDLSDHLASSRAGSRAASTDSDQRATNHVQAKYRLATSSDISKSLERNDSCHSSTNHSQSSEIATNTETQESESKNETLNTTESHDSDECDDNEDASDSESITSLAVSFEEQSVNSQEEFQENEHPINSLANHVNSVPITA